MDLTILNDVQLTEGLDRLVRSERKITHLILCYVNEIESRKVHVGLGFGSMYEFLTKKMGYSEKSAYSRLQAARLLKHVPEVAQKIEDGSVNLSQLTKIQQCIRENVREGKEVSASKTLEIIKQIENKNLFATKVVLSKEFDLPIKDQFERAVPQKDECIRLEITLTKEQFTALTKAKDLLSHICPDGKWSDVIGALAEKFTQAKASPLKTKTSRACGRTDSKDSALPSDTGALVTIEQNGQNTPKLTHSSSSTPNRPHISTAIKRALFEKSRGRCQYRTHENGATCNSTYQLQIDHIQPIAMGGGSELENLRVLCRTHNVYAAEKIGLLRT